MGTRIRTGRMDDYEVLDKLMRRAASTFAGYCDDMHARPGAFSISKTDLEAGRVLVAEHEKGILGDGYYLSGSMNITRNGISFNEEVLHLFTEPSVVAANRQLFVKRWGPPAGA